MTEAEFKNELKRLNGGYLFFGTEDYLKYSYSKEVQKNVLDGEFDDFNHVIIYAEDFSFVALEDAICSLPMMSEKKLVEVRGVSLNGIKKDEYGKLEKILAQLKDNDHTIFILRAESDSFTCGKLPDRPSELYKLLTKYLTPVELNFPSQTRLKSWILRHFQRGRVDFSDSLCEKLVEICGHDMWALSNEIHKLCAYAQMNNLTEINLADIENVCCKSIEYDDFQLTNALLDKNRELVFETLYRQKAAHDSPNLMIASIGRLYSELLLVYNMTKSGLNASQISTSSGIHKYKVGKYQNAVARENPKKLERAVSLCREADIKSKSLSNVGEYIGVERLVSSLCALFCR